MCRRNNHKSRDEFSLPGKFSKRLVDVKRPSTKKVNNRANKKRCATTKNTALRKELHFDRWNITRNIFKWQPGKKIFKCHCVATSNKHIGKCHRSIHFSKGFSRRPYRYVGVAVYCVIVNFRVYFLISFCIPLKFGVLYVVDANCCANPNKNFHHSNRQTQKCDRNTNGDIEW